MEMLSARLEQVHILDATSLPLAVKSALEAHKENLLALYDQMATLNHDVDFLERQASLIIEIYQKELISVMRAGRD